MGVGIFLLIPVAVRTIPLRSRLKVFIVHPRGTCGECIKYIYFTAAFAQ